MQSTCSGGACPARAAYADSEPCSRTQTGVTCAPDVCGAFGSCRFSLDVCDESGMQMRTCTAQVCGGGACGSGATSSQMQACVRDTDGLACDDYVFCTRPDRCFGGNCDSGPWQFGCIEP